MPQSPLSRFTFASAFILALAAAPVPAEEPLTRILFGSCARHSDPQPIWEVIADMQPEVFIHLGDNIYADTDDMEVMKRKYGELAAKPGYARLRRICPRVLATWDDHDYGRNDSNRTYPYREESQQIFLDFFGEPEGSERRRTPGIYDAKVYGPEGKRVQVILLDTRYFRSEHNIDPKRPNAPNRYLIEEDPAATLLGEAQWKWLEERLREPAEVRIIASSIQFLSSFKGIEAWALNPRETRRMYDLIDSTRADGVIFISGDVHMAEISLDERKDAGEGAYPIYDVTSSGITHTLGFALPNTTRIGRPFTERNFGGIIIDWTGDGPSVSLRIYDEEGNVRCEQTVPPGDLRFD